MYSIFTNKATINQSSLYLINFNLVRDTYIKELSIISDYYKTNYTTENNKHILINILSTTIAKINIQIQVSVVHLINN